MTEIEYLRDENARLQDLMDRRPAINAGLVEAYIRWTALCYQSRRSIGSLGQFGAARCAGAGRRSALMTDEDDFQKWWMAPGESFSDEEEIAREAWKASRKQSLLSAKFHPSASHINPDFRDHFNATLDQRIAEIEREEERHRQWRPYP